MLPQPVGVSVLFSILYYLLFLIKIAPQGIKMEKKAAFP